MKSVSKTLKPGNFMVVDLTEDVLVRTAIPKENHAALRSGFAGYPPNPRWNIAKYRAWKIGCQWREALARSEMIVRATDSMLVLATEQQEEDLEEKPPSSEWLQFPLWAKQLIGAYQVV